MNALEKCVTNSHERHTSFTANIKTRCNWDGLEFPVALRDIAVFKEKKILA